MGFEKIRGQDTAVKMLKNSIIGNHISHAYLFAGPEGVGKKAAALAFAQALNCVNSADSPGRGCQTCISCRKVLNSNHPDIEVIKPDGQSIKIDQVRNLKNKVYYKCYESKYKVIIFDDAHLLTIEGANSLLKVLEEPPENTIFVLVTAEPQQLPDTILSRCQQVQFKPLASQNIVDILRIKYPADTDRLKLVAGLAGGSLVKAAGLLEEGELLEIRSETVGFLQRLRELSFSEISLWCEKWDKDKQKIKTIFELTQFWYRDLLVWRTTGQEEILINQDYLADIKSNTNTFTNINFALSLIKDSRRYLEYNVNPRLALEVFFMKAKIN
ncbi:MAG: DNA polymerase III subunit delta' [Peptococcaceae bacterium]